MSEVIKVIDNTAKVIQEFEKKKERALKAIGARAVSYAKKDTPVDTGRLRNSETYQVIGNDVYIGTNVEYAKYQEYKHHFLKNAATNHGDEYKNIFAASMK